MELSWSRFETHRSPKGHGLRARARGRTVEAWQDAAGRWRVRSTSAPQTTPDFRSWPEAREWAEKRIVANPSPEHRPQGVHRRKNREVETSRGVYDTETLVELVDAETGDIDAAGTLEEVLATGKIRMNRDDVIERLARRGFVDFRSSVLREAGPDTNPKGGLGMKVELVDEDDDRIEWRGTLGQFLASNEEIDRDATLLTLSQGYEIGFGGGAAPMMVLRPAEQRAANPRRTMKTNAMQLNPRGKHIACGSQIGKKDCRQLQHVYSSAKQRGFSDERAAKQAWGSLRRNPALPFATVKRFLAIANPAKGTKGEPDTIAGDELELYMDNVEPLYRKWIAIVKNLWRHQAKGRYDHERAVDGFMYLVDDGARRYAKEFASPSEWNTIFDAPTRRYVANEYAKSFENNNRDEIQYAPPGAKQNPDSTAWNVYLDGKKIDMVFYNTGMTADEVRRSLIDHDGYDPDITVERSRPKARRNPSAFDALGTDDQAAALRAYSKGLEAGATGQDIEWTGRMAAFADAGMNDARVALGGARANNPTPPQGAWVVLEQGKPVGLFFAERPIDLADAAKIANGPGGRRRNGAGLGAFVGSLAGSVVGSVFGALGTASLGAGGAMVLAPLSLLLSMAGGAIGGHVGAPRDRKKRGAVGGGIGGVLGPLGAALGGYLGGRKADKRKNPDDPSRIIAPKAQAKRSVQNPSMTRKQALRIIREAAESDASDGTLPSSLGYQEIVQALSTWAQGDEAVREALDTLHGTGSKGKHWVAVDAYESAAYEAESENEENPKKACGCTHTRARRLARNLCA